jgi:hypothetical protein
MKLAIVGRVTRRSMGLPTGREPHGNGVPVVVRAGESPAHGEGGQVTLCPWPRGKRDAKRRNGLGSYSMATGEPR